jgi:hypothetical protein
MVLCNLSTSGIVGPIFFNDIVTADHYLHVPQQAFLLFLQEMAVSFNRTGLGYTLQMQYWMCSIKILMTECCLIVFLNSSDVGGNSHHTLQI